MGNGIRTHELIRDRILSPAPLTRLGNPHNRIADIKAKANWFINIIVLTSLMKTVSEEGVSIKSYGEDISKKLEVFYNPVMKLNRDLSLLLVATYFEKKIKFCDPMAASGIRELRFLKTIPEKFEKLVLGDVSENAIENIKNNFKENSVSMEKVELNTQNATNTIASAYFDYIEVDPFGSPIPFLDIAVQRTKHNGILSVTATDTGPLSGTYPKTCLRRYGIKTQKTLWHEELGLRNLIAYCQRQGAKYDKSLAPILSITHQHFFKVFFKVEESRTKALDNLKSLKYLKYDYKSQIVEICEYEDKETFGKTYVKELNDKEFISKLIENLNLIENKKEVEKLLNALKEELHTLGYYNPHKLAGANNLNFNVKFEVLFDELKQKGFNVSRVHNNHLGIKTNAPSDEIVNLIKKYC